MTPEIWIELLRDVPSVATLIGIIIGVRVSMGNHAVAKRLEAKVTTVETNTNGMLAKANEATKTATAVGEALASGIVAGAQQERDRDKS